MKEFLEKIDDIRFFEVDDFYHRKDEIKEKYNKLNNGEKEMYKWYFYFQFCLLKNPLKEMLWTFLNMECDIYFLSEMANEYRIFCNKRKRLYEKERNEAEFD